MGKLILESVPGVLYPVTNLRRRAAALDDNAVSVRFGVQDNDIITILGEGQKPAPINWIKVKDHTVVLVLPRTTAGELVDSHADLRDG